MGAYARNSHDMPVHYRSLTACQFSLRGAINKCYEGRKRLRVIKEVKDYLFKTHRYTGTIWQWEDKARWWMVEAMLGFLDI